MRIRRTQLWGAQASVAIALIVAGCNAGEPSAVTTAVAPANQSTATVVGNVAIPVAEENAAQQTALPLPAASSTARAGAPTTAPAPNIPADSSAATTEEVIAEVFAHAGPAVVTISPGQGLGSGFLIDDQGHIITNNHVVDGAQNGRVLVSFSGLFDAVGMIVGTDPDSDIAVVKVEELPTGVQPIELGDSDKVRIGQATIAIGNPFGQERTLTTGIVSALGRVIVEQPGAYSIGGAIQTDAAINPGNSGGPLLDATAHVIGMNTAILSQSGTSSGIGFAVPVNLIKKVSSSLIEKGTYDHPWLGVRMREVSTLTAKLENLPSPGIQIAPSAPESPVATAGIAEGAILTAINDQEMTSVEAIIAYLELYTSPGDTITLNIIELDGNRHDVQVTLGARPRVEPQSQDDIGQPPPPLP